MMNEPRVYKNSPFLFISMLFIFGILFTGLVFAMERETWYIMLPFAMAFVLIFLIAIFSMTSKTIISEEDISTQNLLGTKTLRWSEINQVSGRGYGIRLQDVDRGLTVAPSAQLPGYPEVIEWIGVKRPDLFNPQEYNELSRGWASRISPLILGLLLVGAGIFGYIMENETFFPFLIFAIMGLVFMGMSLASPQTISLQGNSMLIGYLFNQKTLLADEISLVELRYTQTRNGKQYFIAIQLTNSKSIRLSGFKPSLPTAYLTLKNWHKKNSKSEVL
jgi:MFS family permease